MPPMPSHRARIIPVNRRIRGAMSPLTIMPTAKALMCSAAKV